MSSETEQSDATSAPDGVEPVHTPAATLSREAILAVDDVKIIRVYVPAWRGYVHLKTLTGSGRDAFEEASLVNGKQSYENVRARLLSQTICDEHGAVLFSQEDVVALGNKSAAALSVLWNEAAKLNVVTEEDVQELVGNSERVAIASS